LEAPLAKNKPYVLSEVEHYFRGFLIDLSVRDTLPLFKKAHITAYQRDPETVHEAWEESRMIVTNNEKDFIRYVAEHSKRDSGKTCLDCWGLLIVPGDKITRSRVIPKVKNGIMLGGKLTPWAPIAYANLCVSLHADGSVGVRRFRRCLRCEKVFPITDKWYKALPLIPTKSAKT
jgi:hypothetical protein